jgi:hypothetical protein
MTGRHSYCHQKDDPVWNIWFIHKIRYTSIRYNQIMCSLLLVPCVAVFDSMYPCWAPVDPYSLLLLILLGTIRSRTVRVVRAASLRFVSRRWPTIDRVDSMRSRVGSACCNGVGSMVLWVVFNRFAILIICDTWQCLKSHRHKAKNIDPQL